MSDVKLRSKLIRLAHAKPELRAQILPLLKTARPTFVEAKQTILDYLGKHGWKLSAPGLKVMHATSKDGKVRLWFKAQAVYFTYSTGRHDFGEAHSLQNDIRSMTPEAFVKDADETARADLWVERDAEKSDKKASSDILDRLIPRNDMVSLYRKLSKDDKQSAELLRAVYSALKEKLSLSGGEGEAFTRLSNTISQGQNWDSGLLRNNIFKAADSLGMKLPSMMF